MPDSLTALDATFVELEQQDEGALMGIGGVSVFDPVPGGGAASVGNRISSLFIDLPIATAGGHERHKRIAAATARLKASRAAAGATAMLDLAALAPPVVADSESTPDIHVLTRGIDDGIDELLTLVVNADRLDNIEQVRI